MGLYRHHAGIFLTEPRHSINDRAFIQELRHEEILTLSFDKIIKKSFYDTHLMTGRQRSEFSFHLPRSVYFSYNDSFFLSGFTERIF